MVVRLLLPTACDGGVRGGVRGRSRRGGDLCTVALRALTSAATEPGASGFATPGSYTTESGGGRTTAALATAASTAVAAAADDGWPSPPLLPAPAPQLWFSGCCRPEPRHSSPRDVCTSCLDDAPGCMIPTAVQNHEFGKAFCGARSYRPSVVRCFEHQIWPHI